MTLLSLSNQLDPAELPLEQIYLDPNNPRFVEANWPAVSRVHPTVADIFKDSYIVEFLDLPGKLYDCQLCTDLLRRETLGLGLQAEAGWS